jgi:hypothetical protein
MRDVERIRSTFPRLLPARESLVGALHEATRVRNGMKVAAVTHLGTVRNTAYFALKDTADGRAFVAWHRIVSDENHIRLARVIRELEEDAAASHGHGARIPRAILVARARLLAAETLALLTTLDAATATAPLCVAQRTRSDTVRAMLVERQHRLQYVIDGAQREALLEGHAAPSGAALLADHRRRWEDDVLDIADAARQLRLVTEYQMTSDRELWSRIVHGIRLLHLSPASEHALRASAPATDVGVSSAPRVAARPRGRGVVNAFERISFALWAARRFGGPLYGGVSEQARRCIGEFRNTRVIVSALLDPAERTSHTELCSSLGFMDTVEARDGLVAYLKLAVADDATLRTGDNAGAGAVTSRPQERTNASAISTAVFGLARLPFGGRASELRATEREVLITVRETFRNVRTRAYAAAVLDGWDQNWNSIQWMCI